MLWLLLALCLLPGAVLGWVLWRGYPASLFTPNDQLVVRDYLNIWAGGRLAMAGRTAIIFDPHAYAAWLRSLFGSRLDLFTWGYPPHLLILAVPFSWLPLVPGFLLWIVATSVLLWMVLRAGGLPVSCTLAAVCSPAALENALGGQNGALTTAALAGGALLSGRRPVLAGALLGLLTIKPQLGLLVPIALVARRDWRTLGWAIGFGALYCGAGLLLFGWQAWWSFFTVITPFVRGFLDAPFGRGSHYMMVPPFITMRAAGASLAWSYAVQSAVAVLCAALTWWAWSRRGCDHRAAAAFVLCLAPLATPYAHSYDLVCVAVACVLLGQIADERGGLRFSDCLLMGPAWVWPGVAFLVGRLLAPGLGGLCIAPVVVMAARHIWRGAPVSPEPGALGPGAESGSRPAVALDHGLP